MGKYIIIRLILLFITLFIMTSLIFIILRSALYIQYSISLLDNLENIFFEYCSFIKGVFTKWDWGKTMNNESVWKLFKRRAPYTLSINLLAFVFYIFFGILLGIISTLQKDKIIDQVIGFFTMSFASIHAIALTFILMLILGYSLKLVPTIYPFDTASNIAKMKGFIIPILALSLEPIARLTRIIRGELSETIYSEYMLLAKIKGLKTRYIILHHGLKNCFTVVLPFISSTFILVICNSFFVEVFYNIPGIATWFKTSLVSPLGDGNYLSIDTYSLVMIGSFYTFLSLIVTFIVDIIYKFFDPRIKIGSKKLSM